MRALLPLAALVVALSLPGLAPAHQGHGDPAPWAACEGVQTGEACSFRPASGDLHRGTCQTIGGHPVCVRNKPIIPAGSDGTPLWVLTAVGVLGGLMLLASARRWAKAS